MQAAFALAYYTYFNFVLEFDNLTLAPKLDSLVRVSRRIGKRCFSKIILSPEVQLFN